MEWRVAGWNIAPMPTKWKWAPFSDATVTAGPILWSTAPRVAARDINFRSLNPFVCPRGFARLFVRVCCYR